MRPVTVADVIKIVQGIDGLRADPEAAHSAEDRLHQTVLLAIANDNCEDPRACAAEALKTKNISFARWCA